MNKNAKNIITYLLVFVVHVVFFLRAIWFVDVHMHWTTTHKKFAVFDVEEYYVEVIAIFFVSIFQVQRDI